MQRPLRVGSLRHGVAGSLVAEEQLRATDLDRDVPRLARAPRRHGRVGPGDAVNPEPVGAATTSSFRDVDLKLPSWRWEAARTTLWIVPTLLVVAVVGLFVLTLTIDHVAFHDAATLPALLRTGSADAGREVLIAIAAAVITVVGVVFSITILALTLASQQFGPRMMRNFVRDVGSQLTLGVLVATFVYSVLALGSITSGFVPHLTITVAEALLLVDVGVLIYFIHHIARTIQLPEVIASIARDLMKAIDAEFPLLATAPLPPRGYVGATVPELLESLDRNGMVVSSKVSGYLQHVAYAPLVAIAARHDAVIRLDHLPGHFIVAGRPLAKVWPPTQGVAVAASLERSHVTGPHRTLLQDPVFAIDQLVEIAIRALSPAVNDTFTALTCIDWLSAGLSELSRRSVFEGVSRDRTGQVRLISRESSYSRMVNRAFDKVRQCAGGMPAVQLRLLDSIRAIGGSTTSSLQRDVLRRQADMVLVLAEATVPEENDLRDVRGAHAACISALGPGDAAAS
jgi:uncharacterized membrane protein